MFRGILAFITSGALLNPVVFVAVICGIIMGIRLEFDEFWAVYQNKSIYLCALLISLLFNLLFNRVFLKNGQLNYVAMLGNIAIFCLKFLMVSALSFMLVYLFKF